MGLAVITQVLLRPRRIGTLVVLGGMTGVVVVGAEDWWTVLGIVLFQMAACALLVTWVDIAHIGKTASPRAGLVVIPRPRRPAADEYRTGE